MQAEPNGLEQSSFTPAKAGSLLPAIDPVPGWERYPWLRAGFSTRQNGASGVYGTGELNLGWTVEDDPAAVLNNRAAFVRHVAGEPGMPLVTVRQVHSAVVRDLDQEAPPLMSAEGKALLEGDGMISRTPGRLLGILTADCVPVLVADIQTHAVGAFHAGWRGTLGGIVESGVRAMETHYAANPANLIAAIGPCIRRCCFEVGAEVRDAFSEHFPYGSKLFRDHVDGPLTMDLVEANRRQLLQCGVPAEAITVMAGCTACSRLPDGRRTFFSYRSEKGRTGRMLSAIAALA